MSPTTNGNHLHDLRSYSRNWLSEFIDLYQAEECLWQPKHQDYSNHTIRNKAYDRLVEKLKEVEPNPDRAMVVRKINSLRSAFRREYRKLSSKTNYETRLWYYDKLLFIAEQKPHRHAQDDTKAPKRSLPLTFDDDDSMEYEADDNPLETTDAQAEQVTTLTVAANDCVTLVKNEGHHTEQQQQQIQHAAHIQHASTQSQPQHSTEVKVLEITSLDSNSQRQIQQAVNSLEQQHQMQQLQQQQSGQTATQLAQIHQQVPTIQIAREHLQPLFGNSFSTTALTHRQEDEFDAIGVNVASKLRVMNPHQRIIAEKLISDLLRKRVNHHPPQSTIDEIELQSLVADQSIALHQEANRNIKMNRHLSS